MALDYIALAIMVVVFLILFYSIIVIHDIPYEIAKRRNHPHQDAIHYAGWVSLFTLHALWPFLWIWATLWREDRGWGMKQMAAEQHDMHHQMTSLLAQVDDLKNEIRKLKAQPGTTSSHPSVEEEK
ncbi:DUF3302 domain-containing protein [[Enterobacter] lignolyticus]|uniref:GTPase n=1 Tax=Enterobacter lignolyticus (strain SCF1) TaxID=701347 RepID=E3G7J3_ENTLS|nr:DUF3302 domain-containing protein [[Enterobacter] lignolyticus]ADO49693.1 hypothetical protein Entcl_3448 [[Enterobacter] lignolyticus SCF1]